MAWRSTEEAPAPEWTWDAEEAARGDIGAEEEAACRAVDNTLRAEDGHGVKGRVVLDLGCGRGACLRWAHLRGTRRLVGVDRSKGALQATRACLGDAVELVEAEAMATGLSSGLADLVWSHGVVEHLRPAELGAYLAEAVRLSRRWVAFSAPNPGCGVYQAFRAKLLAEEAWVWGYEEPLPSYAPALESLGCAVVADHDVGRTWSALAPYGDRLGPRARAHWRALAGAGGVPGIYTVVVARVPAGEGA